MEIVNANETEVPKCDHFSIRGYVAKKREVDKMICWPFDIVANSSSGKNQVGPLPPLHVPEWRWWGCDNCLRRAIVMGDIERTGESFSRSRENNRSEARTDGIVVNVNASEEDTANLSLGNEIKEMEAEIAQPIRDKCPIEGHGHDNHAEGTEDTNDTVDVHETENEKLALDNDTERKEAEINEPIREDKCQVGPYDSTEESGEISTESSNELEGGKFSAGDAMEEIETAVECPIKEAESPYKVRGHDNDDCAGDEVSISSHVPMQLSGSPQSLEEKISEEKRDDNFAFANVDVNEKQDPLIVNDLNERETTTTDAVREESNDVNSEKAEENIVSNETRISLNIDYNVYDESARDANTSSELVCAHERILEFVTPEPRSCKRKLEDNSKKDHENVPSDCGTSTINKDIEKNAHEFSENEEHRKKACSLNDLLGCSAEVGVVYDEEQRKLSLDFDLNCHPPSPVDSQEAGEKVSLCNNVIDVEEMGKKATVCDSSMDVEEESRKVSLYDKGKGIVTNDQDERLSQRNYVMIDLNKNAQTEIGTLRSAFQPWMDLNDTLNQVVAGTSTSASVNQVQTNIEHSLIPHEHHPPSFLRLSLGQFMSTEPLIRPTSQGCFNSVPWMSSTGSSSQYFPGQQRFEEGRAQVRERLNRQVPHLHMQHPIYRQAMGSNTGTQLNLNSCITNRNPADFSFPKAGNEYMISYKDL